MLLGRTSEWTENRGPDSRHSFAEPICQTLASILSKVKDAKFRREDILSVKEQ